MIYGRAPSDLSRFGIEKQVRGEMLPADLDWLFNTASKVDLGGTIIEIGVLNGLSSLVINHAIQGKMIRHYCIDNWTMNDGVRHDEVKQEFLKTMEGRSYFLFDWDSTAAAFFFPYNSVDFLFLDGNHLGTKPFEDIKAWWPRIKDGGIISGHDSHFPGVHTAIKEFFGYEVGESIFEIRRENENRHTLHRR